MDQGHIEGVNITFWIIGRAIISVIIILYNFILLLYGFIHTGEL